MQDTPADPLEVMAAGRFLRMVKRGRWEYVDRHNAAGAVAVVAVTEAGELILIEQHRVPMGRACIELPAGLAGDGANRDEAFERAARRELEEETGYRAATMRHLYQVCTSPGMTSETIDLFLATGLTRIGDGGGAAGEGEDIRVHRVPIGEAEQWVAQRGASGDCVDVKVYLGIALARDAIKTK
ncbi:MAG: NUDIX hydrolase [Phycisphaerales bacterium JB063]